MKKNVASQVIGAELVSASDGSAFTGSVTAYVTGDGGTQAVGSVSSGACTHEGNGFHTYAPAQAETNYDHIGFTFIGSGAVPVTVQVYTTFPQTGDNYARLGAPAGASVSADVAAVKSDTGEIGAAGAGLTEAGGDGDHLTEAGGDGDHLTEAGGDGDHLTEAGGTGDQLTALATAANLATLDGKADDILTDTGTTLPATLATIAGYIDTEVAAILADTGTTLDGKIDAIDTLVTAIKAVTDVLPDSGALTSLAQASALATVDGNVDAILTDTGTTLPATLATIAGYIDTEIAAILTDTGTTLDGKIDAIKAVTDLLTTARAEPTGVPAANEDPLTKLDYIFMGFRNKVTVTSSKKTYFGDDDAAEFEKDLSDDGTTYTESEANAV